MLSYRASHTIEMLVLRRMQHAAKQGLKCARWLCCAETGVCHFGTLPGGWISAKGRALLPWQDDEDLVNMTFSVWQPYCPTCQLQPLLTPYLEACPSLPDPLHALSHLLPDPLRAEPPTCIACSQPACHCHRHFQFVTHTSHSSCHECTCTIGSAAGCLYSRCAVRQGACRYSHLKWRWVAELSPPHANAEVSMC